MFPEQKRALAQEGTEAGHIEQAQENTEEVDTLPDDNIPAEQVSIG